MGEIAFEQDGSRQQRSVPLGRIVLTSNARKAISTDELLAALNRHEQGDWGNASTARTVENNQALASIGPLCSTCAAANGTTFYIATKTDRSATLVCLEGELPSRIAAKGGLQDVTLPRAASLSPCLRVVTVQITHDNSLRKTLSNSEAAAELIRARIGRLDREHFVALHLDTKHRVQALEIISIGSLAASLVHPREVFKAAILSNASAIICAHNHPSGDPEPSHEDRAVMRQLEAAAQLLGIELLDFLIVTSSATRSLREELKPRA
jgi:DNA repair protein RadC